MEEIIKYKARDGKLFDRAIECSKYEEDLDLIATRKKKESFVVALQTGGLMECPQIEYRNYQIIEAYTPEEAVKEYNRINNCNFYYGKCMGKASEDIRKTRKEA